MSTSQGGLLITLDPAVKAWPLDVSAKEERYLVETAAQRRFEVSGGIYQIISLLKAGSRTIEELAAELKRGGFAQADPHQLFHLVRTSLIPRGIVNPLEHDTEPLPSTPMLPRRSSYLRVQVPLVGPETLRPITTLLQPLFQRTVVALAVGAAVLAHVYFYTTVFPGFTWSAMSLPLTDYLLITLALNVTIILHELGHASACAHYGCSYGKIGWGIYIFMPVLYTDVSAVWRLPRWQRAMVDAAGMYFELIASTVMLALALATGNPLFIYIFLFLDLSILSSLNPILRRDGYWLLADVSGQPHLRGASLEVLQGLGAWLLRRPAPPQPLLGNMPPWLRGVLYLYSAVAVLFSIRFTLWMVEQVAVEIAPAMPGFVATMAAALAAEPVAWAVLLEALARMVFAAIFGFLILSAIWGFALAFGRWLRQTVWNGLGKVQP